MSSATTPSADQLKIFFDLEDDILSVVEYLALLIDITAGEMTEDETRGAHRLILAVQDHALAIREGFRKAFWQAEGAT